MDYEKRIQAEISFLNDICLGRVYNRRILADSDADILVFTHDDIWIDDYFIVDRVTDALAHFELAGIAGNRRLPKQHVGWCFLNEEFEWDQPQFLSGKVAHGPLPFGPVSPYGITPAPCELLDGVFMCARRSVLRKAGLKFDPAFGFNFHDLDFCRRARESGLRVGTWPIAITHASSGGNTRYGYATDDWKNDLTKYREKWDEIVVA